MDWTGQDNDTSNMMRQVTHWIGGLKHLGKIPHTPQKYWSEISMIKYSKKRKDMKVHWKEKRN